MKKVRVEIPKELIADVLFQSDQTCCICRIKDKTVQIHHIDDNPANNDQKNLAVLCLECHHKTQIRGGFGRKLSPELVIRYRDDWLAQVSKTRASNSINSHFEGQNISISQINLLRKLSERQIDEINDLEKNICILTEWFASYNYSSLDQNKVRSLYTQTNTMGLSLGRYDKDILAEFYNFMNAAGVILDQGGRMRFSTAEENNSAVSRLDTSRDKLIDAFKRLREE